MFGLVPRKKAERALARMEEGPLGRMRREFTSLFDRFFAPWPVVLETPFDEEIVWGLTVEDKEKEVMIRAELPGFEAGELDVEILDGELIIRAEHKEEKKEKEEFARALGRVERRMTLPMEADAEKAEARYVNGVLEVRMPKKPAPVGKKVAVTT